MSTETLFQAVLSGCAGILVALIGVWFSRRKNNAEAGKLDADAIETLARSSVSMLAPLNAEINRLQMKVEQAHEQASELLADLEHAKQLLRENGIPWRPRVVEGRR